VQNSVKRDPSFPDVPTTADLAKSDDDRSIMKLFAIGSDIGRTFILPPGVPADRIAIVRKAFMDAMRDPELIAAARQSNLDLDPMSGEEIQAMINGIGGMSPELLKKAQAAKQWNK
jgi:tripartite-type tricarboxylate transporter receptor subunit TctC